MCRAKSLTAGAALRLSPAQLAPPQGQLIATLVMDR